MWYVLLRTGFGELTFARGFASVKLGFVNLKVMFMS